MAIQENMTQNQPPIDDKAVALLYEDLKDSYDVGSLEDFKVYLSDKNKRDLFFEQVIKPEYDVETIDDFESAYGFTEKKNQVDTPSVGQEEVTESITETPTEPGSLDSSQENVEQPVEVVEQTIVSDTEQDEIPEVSTIELTETDGVLTESIYTSTLLDELTSQVQIAQEINKEQNKKNFYKYKAESSFVRRTPKPKEKNPDALLEIDEVLREKILSDFNIKKALEFGIIDKNLITNALKGDLKAISSLSNLATKSPEEYRQEIKDKKLNSKYGYANDSDLSVKYSREDRESGILDGRKKEAEEKVKKINAETQKLLDEIPIEERTEERLSNIFNREVDATEEEFDLAEDEYVPTGFEGSDIDKMYDVQNLQKLAKDGEKFDVKEFDGYLKEQGYFQTYKNMIEEGTVDETGESYSMYSSYNQGLAAERLKAQYLTNFINDRVEKRTEFQIVNYQLENEGRHPVLDGVELDISTGLDDKAVTQYIEKQFPMLTAKLKQQDVKNQENYQKYLDGGNPVFTQSVKQGWRSIEDRVNSFSEGTYEGIGANNIADQVRMQQAENQLSRDDFMRYAYASGKKAYFDGREYGIDERGQIYDLDIKKNVTTVLTDAMSKEIRKEVSKSNETFKSTSGAGIAIATTGIVSDMLLQIALTRGVGVLGQGVKGGAVLFQRGKNVVKVLEKIPMKATTASAMIAQGTLFSTNLGSSTYKNAIENGIDEATARELQTLAAQQGFALGSITAPISTQAVAMNKIFGASTNKISQAVVSTYQNGGKKGLTEYFKRLQQTVTSNYPIYIRESGKEVFQENVQQGGQAFVIGNNVNEIAKKEIMANTITGAEYTNTTILAGLAGLLMPFGGDLSSTTKTSLKANFNPGAAAIDRLEALHKLSENVEKTEEFLNSMVTNGAYTEEQVSDLLADIDVYVNTINSIPTNLTPETSLAVMRYVNEIKKQEALKEKRDKSFHPAIDKKINDLRNEITIRTQFDYVNSKGKLKLKEEAGRELNQEAIDAGETDITITDGAITQRAIDNFNQMDVDTKLEYTDLDKSDLKTKTDKDAISKPSTEEQVLPDAPTSKKEGGDSEVELRQVGEGDAGQVTTDTQVEESETQTDTTSDTTTETDAEQLTEGERYLESKRKIVEDLEAKDKSLRSEDGSVSKENQKAWKENRAAIVKAKEFLLTGDTTGKDFGAMMSYEEGSTQATATKANDTEQIKKNENEIEAVIQRVIDGKITAEDATQYIAQKFGFYVDQVNVLSRYIAERSDSSFPEIGNNKSKFKDWRKGNKTTDTTTETDAEQSQPTSTEEGMSVNNENSVESFANRIVQEGVNQEGYSDEAIQFYSENKEAIDNAVSQKKKQQPKTKSKERALAIKIARGDTEFSDAEIDLYSKSEGAVQVEVEAIGKTNSQTVTADTYKSIIASTKSTTRQDMAKPESENAQRKKFWKSWNRSAREKKMDLNQKRKSLNDGIKAYAKKRKGTVTSAQTRAIINKINNVNLDNPAQVKKVQEYAEKVFSDADFAKDIEIATKLSNSTTKRLNSGKLGDNGNFNAAVSQLVTLPISDLDAADLKAYNELLKKVSKRSKKTKLDNEFVKEANDLLNSIKSKELETDSELEYDEVEGFVYKEGTQQVIDKILDEDVSGETIIEKNSDFIENKLDALDSATLEILVDKVNSAENESNSEIVEQLNDYAKNRNSLINTTVKKSKKVNLNNISKISKDQNVGPRTLTNLNKGQLAMLTGTELSELDIHLDNISEGFYTYYANKIAQKVEANQRATNIAPMIDKMFTAKGKFSTTRQYIAAAVKSQYVKTGAGSQAAKKIGIKGQMIRSNPLSVIDNMFGNYKNNIIYDNTIKPTAEAYAGFKNWVAKQTDVLDAVESLLAPGRTELVNKSVKRRFELTTYLLQKEFESNSNKKGTSPAIEFIEGTIEKYNKDPKSSKYNKKSIAILEEIAEQYKQDGQISLKKMDESMSAKTKKALNMLEGVYSGLGELQSYATRIVRGNELDLVNNYVHHRVTYEGRERYDATFNEAVNFLSMSPSSKSKTSFERKGATSIDFDPITTALRATRNTGLDYFMSNEISTTKQALGALKTMSGKDKSKTKKQNEQTIEAAQDLNKIYNEALNNVITNNLGSEVIGGKALSALRTTGYYSTLASIPRAGAEYASNLAFAALATPGETALGMTKYMAFSMTTQGRLVVENTLATTGTKLYSDDQLGGSKADTQGVSRKKSSKQASNNLNEVLEYATRMSGANRLPGAIDKIGETLVTLPDQMISRPLWFGTFAMSFKSETGSYVDFDKIADNDSDYMDKYKTAIRNATRKADKNVTMAATSNDPFSSVLKNQAQDKEGSLNYYRLINGYMSRFTINEYATARQAIASMVGQGQLSVVKGASTLAAVGVRMSMYVMLLRYLNGAMFGMLGIGDEDDIDYEELGIRQMVGAGVSLITRGVSGNIPMILPNMMIEEGNKIYGHGMGLRDKEEYKGIQDALVYATMSTDNVKRNLAESILIQSSGPLNPQVKSFLRVFKTAGRGYLNQTEKSRQENLDKLYSSRTAIEIANVLGGIPFYRDIRTGFVREEFKEVPSVRPYSLKELEKYDNAEYQKVEAENEYYKKTPEYQETKELQKVIKKLKKEIGI